MSKFKKVMLTVTSVIVVAIFAFFFIHTPQTDRFNPFIQKITSYAKVKKGTQNYYLVQAINPKTGENLSYKLSEVGGYDDSKEYIEITHKGQYIEKISYISKEKFEKAKQK
ncbi:YxeA family protein [Lactobacillus mulieris]|uniref:YxeA family protein n=1 Tax=Lactobacillus mulieris TaxID=2508708 RepID=A0AAW5WW62_9LACO|nr:YxeA family protein [Lactobacillus mulieris]MCZ3621453.1 YxeA family protein [Lactobacillus mulieris]MCZ3623271.1 YxeA family protein [Lactobacillus mulieris]MCZ3635460.1 YxeA family protein [Lactobacillus mulieris]MCZ3689432.1 YxeA family protein [Lactobacillus mulieris]MCZ3695435.1 YxeA family protein [Lactobacillus mulieris]